MKSSAKTVSDYIQELEPDRKQVIETLTDLIKTHLTGSFSEEINYGMIGYVVPHSSYPNGYHCDPKLPLPFINVASQKNFVALYHMGIYANPELLKWFQSEYPKHSKRKLDMGKSCIRFKKMDDIPFELIGQLISKMSVNQWIELYEKNIDNR